MILLSENDEKCPTKIREIYMELTNSNGLGFLALAPVDGLAIETSSSLGPPSSLRFSSSLSCCNFRRALDDILGFKKTKFIKSSGVLFIIYQIILLLWRM